MFPLIIAGLKGFLLAYQAASMWLDIVAWWEGPKPDPWCWWRRIFWAVVVVLLLSQGGVG